MESSEEQSLLVQPLTLEVLTLQNAVSTSFLASIVLPRFEIQIAIAIFISSTRFPEWIRIVCAYLFFSSTLFLKFFYFFIKFVFYFIHKITFLIFFENIFK